MNTVASRAIFFVIKELNNLYESQYVMDAVNTSSQDLVKSTYSDTFLCSF
jgi:hypothetical protein